MSRARYLIRFDDICPSMNWETWERIEALLDNHGVRPLLAVVPDNRDPSLVVDAAREDFWPCVRAWQARGWSIGLHGYQHCYETRTAGLIGLNARSEFAGLPEAVQAEKLDAALAVFRRERVSVDCWIAPGHSFDATTVSLLRGRDVTTISDGYFRHPVRWMGCTWVPQQLWRFRAFPGGVWTVCYHHNGFQAGDLARFSADLERYGPQITSLDEITAGEIGARSLADSCLAAFWRLAIRTRRAAASHG
jgi:predicted deacetylase